MAKFRAMLSGELLNTVLLLVVLTSACSSSKPPVDAGQPQGIPVKLAAVETETVQETSDAVGKLEAERALPVKTETDGRISQISVKEGDRVTPGQKIVVMDDREVQAQLGQANANVARAQARVKELRAGTRPEEIAQAEATVAQNEAQVKDAQSQLTLAQNQFRRNEMLANEGAISRQTLDQMRDELSRARANLEQTQARVVEAQERLKQLRAGPRQEEIERAEAELAEAIAQVRTNEVNIQDTRVVAPIAGIIGNIPVKPGQYLKAGDDVTTITQNQFLNLRMFIPIERVSDLRLGLPVVLRSPDNKAQLDIGRVSFISPQSNADSQIMIKAIFDNAKGNLRNEQFVRAKVIWNQRPGAVVVPNTALNSQGRERFVYVAEGDPLKTVARRQPVEVGLDKGDRTEIRKGLQPGQKIVVSGIQKLFDGAPVMPLPSDPQANQPAR